MRRWFRSPHLYLAILVAVALQVPVLIWNAQHGAASFGFIVGGHVRPQGRGGSSINPESLRGFIVGGLGVLSPFLLYPLTRFVFAGRDGHGYARMVFLLSSGGFFLASLGDQHPDPLERHRLCSGPAVPLALLPLARVAQRAAALWHGGDRGRRR